MDAEQIKYLTPQQKERFVRLEKLFGSEGWKDIEAWGTVNAAVSTNRQLTASSWDQFNIAQGARLAYQSVVELRAATELEYEQLAEDAQTTAENDDSLDHE